LPDVSDYQIKYFLFFQPVCRVTVHCVMMMEQGCTRENPEQAMSELCQTLFRKSQAHFYQMEGEKKWKIVLKGEQ
jgi:hypothetical protein